MSELSKYYRIPASAHDVYISSQPAGTPGFFRFGPDAICYGASQTAVTRDVAHCGSFDAAESVRIDNSTVHFPFEFDEIIDNLRRERYEECLMLSRERVVNQPWVRKAYYFVRELLPVPIRRHLQRLYFSDWKSRRFPQWPVDCTVDTLHEEALRLVMKALNISRIPFIWFWPEGASSCLIMTHDVETAAGRDFTHELMNIDESHGLKASFQVIPEKRYEVPDEYVREIRNRGFEFNIHDLSHDGDLYRERQEFLRRAAKINSYARRYDARGFRAGAMYRNLDWYDAFEFSYDMSVPNVAHLEPKRGGCCTVFPFFIGSIVEIPVTMAQDYSIFHILNDYSINLWKQQIKIVQSRHGLISFITHPDYLISLRARGVYELLLNYLRHRVLADGIWAALPREVDHWWRVRCQLNLVKTAGQWKIEGPEQERARIAYAVLDDDKLVYELPGVMSGENVGSVLT